MMSSINLLVVNSCMQCSK